MRWFIGIIVVLIIGIGTYAWFNKDVVTGWFGANEEVPLPQVEEPRVKTYASSTMGISFDYPPAFELNDAYAYQGFSGKPIQGVSVTIDPSMATGTNLSGDSYVSVEQLPRANNCTGDIFMTANVRAVDLLENGVEYSVASSSEGAAGNRYSEVVYALKGSNPCTALRYFIHSTNLENYPAGTVRQFDETAILRTFDEVRRTLLLSQ